MKITKRITNEIIFEDNSNTIKDSVINAVAAMAELRNFFTFINCQVELDIGIFLLYFPLLLWYTVSV